MGTRPQNSGSDSTMRGHSAPEKRRPDFQRRCRCEIELKRAIHTAERVHHPQNCILRYSLSDRARQLLAYHAVDSLTLPSCERSTEERRRAICDIYHYELHLVRIIAIILYPQRRSGLSEEATLLPPILPSQRALFSMLRRQAGIMWRCTGNWE